MAEIEYDEDSTATSSSSPSLESFLRDATGVYTAISQSELAAQNAKTQSTAAQANANIQTQQAVNASAVQTAATQQKTLLIYAGIAIVVIFGAIFLLKK